MVVLSSLCQVSPSPIPTTISSSSCSSSNTIQKGLLTRRRTVLLGQSLIATSLLHLFDPIHSPPSLPLAIALQQQDELQQEEDRIVNLFQVSFSFLFWKFTVFCLNQLGEALEEMPFWFWQLILLTHFGSHLI